MLMAFRDLQLSQEPGFMQLPCHACLTLRLPDANALAAEPSPPLIVGCGQAVSTLLAASSKSLQYGSTVYAFGVVSLPSLVNHDSFRRISHRRDAGRW